MSAATFKEQAKALQQQNPVYAMHEFDEKAVDAWPKDGTPPQVLLECCVQLPSEVPTHQELHKTIIEITHNKIDEKMYI